MLKLSEDKRTLPPFTASSTNPLCLNQRLGACIAQVPLTPFVGYNCCPCCSNAFALLVVPVAPILIYIYSFEFISHPTRFPPHITTVPPRNNMRTFTFTVSSLPTTSSCPLPRSYHLPHSCRRFTSHTQSDPRPHPRPPRPCLFPTLSNGTCLSGHSKKSPTGWPTSGRTSASTSAPISRVL